jgi:hypothetical protein
VTLALLARYWKYAAMGVLAIALALAWHSRDTWRDAAHTWKNAFAAQKQAYEAAQSAAAVKLAAQRKELKTDYDTIAERADHAETKVNDLLAASDRFARANRVSRKASVGASGGPSASGQGDSAAGDLGPGGDTILVPVGDFDTLVRNTGRLIKANDWFKELESRGLAEAAPKEN